MYEYRQVLVRLRQGDSDRDVARSRLMGRRKVAEVRQQATSQGWLDAQQPLPDDAALAAVFSDTPRTPTAVSTLEPWREQIATWVDAGVQGTTIHATLRRNHGYTGSYSAVRRFVQHMAAQRPLVTTMRLTFLPRWRSGRRSISAHQTRSFSCRLPGNWWPHDCIP